MVVTVVVGVSVVDGVVVGVSVVLAVVEGVTVVVPVSSEAAASCADVKTAQIDSANKISCSFIQIFC